MLLHWAGVWGGEGDVYDLCWAEHPWMTLLDDITQGAVGGTYL
jgi:hypothetical protein